jgi:methionyl-tRNA formyltransferase
MRIVLLCASMPHQVALANKIASEFNLAGIVVEKKSVMKAKKLTLKNIAAKFVYKIAFRQIANAWSKMLDYYKHRYIQLPDTKVLEVANINDDTVKNFITAAKADLVMVSGTSMIRKNILSVPLTIGMINLHTGLSPYIKGAPNCTNWCIANNQLHLIGNSVMWIDAGIDSGDLLATSIVGFTGKENLAEVHVKVMEEAHALYLKAVRTITYNTAKRVKQSSIATGKTYYSKDWNFAANKRLLKNFKNFEQETAGEAYKQKVKETITIPAE